MVSKIEEILNERRGKAVPEDSPAGDKFFSILRGEGLHEHFLELQFRNGLQTCFSYDGLSWFNYDPESGCIDLEFGGFLVTVRGRGLKPLFNGIKSKRVAWVREANDVIQDHTGNESYVEEISITAPQGYEP